MRLLEEVKGARRIGLTAHEKPDGDAVGAVMAMARYLDNGLDAKKNGIRIHAFLEEYADALHRNIPGDEYLCPVEEAGEEPYDVFFVLDSGKERTGAAQALADRAKRVVNIDHHVSNKSAADVAVIDPSCSSTCELLYRLMEPEYLDREIAQALYVGIVTDTGVYRYSNTSTETMQVASALMDYGFPFSRIIEETFYEKTFQQQLVLGLGLASARLMLDGNLIVSALPLEKLKAMGIEKKDVDGVSSQLILTEGVHCAAFLYEAQESLWRVSLRSDEKIDVAKIAEAFDGGGHMRAAGCKMYDTMEENIAALAAAVREQLSK